MQSGPGNGMHHPDVVQQRWQGLEDLGRSASVHRLQALLQGHQILHIVLRLICSICYPDVQFLYSHT